MLPSDLVNFKIGFIEWIAREHRETDHVIKSKNNETIGSFILLIFKRREHGASKRKYK